MPNESAVGPMSLLAGMTSYLDIPRSLRPPIWRELIPALPVPSGRHRSAPAVAPPGRVVVVVPGFGAPDVTTAVLRSAVVGAGHRTHRARLGTMIGCSELLASKLVARLDALAPAGPDQFTLVGHSRGGQICKVAARRRPDLVDGLITLGSPLIDPWGMHLSVKFLIVAMKQLSRGGLDVGGCEDIDCPFGACSIRFNEDLRGKLAAHVRFTSIYSRRDGIVQWRTCLDPHARHVEVPCSHLQMTHHPQVTSEILQALAPTPAELPT